MTATVSQRTPLQDYLDPSMEAHLAQHGDLPEDIRLSLGVQVRQDLQACAAYIPSRLVRTQLTNPEPGRVSGAFWQGSIVFADLSGFTNLCDKLSVLGKQGAEEVSTVVNHLFGVLVAEVFAYKGELLKFGGDALTAFFDAQTLGPNHAAAATLAALAMQKRMAAFAVVETRAGSFRLRLRIGVNSGRVFAAEVGDKSHIEVVVTGSEVNRVATAQQHAAPGEVVVSDQTAALIERAHLIPKKPGFLQVIALPEVLLPIDHAQKTNTEQYDIETLTKMATQAAALRPYLVRSLPRRFLDTSTSEVGEFRPVSVLFANFYDFSSLLYLFGDDTTSAAHALNAYFCRVQNVVHTYEGTINKIDMYTHGDKLMALFGAPSANEHDPLNAVRCALELEAVLEESNTEIAALLELHYEKRLSEDTRQVGAVRHNPLSAILRPSSSVIRQRIGINTGTVYAGRVGGAQRYEYTVMGPAVNLAARIMEVAEEGNVLLSPTTRSAVERQIALVEQAPVNVKGLSDTITPWRALGEEHTPAFSSATKLKQSPLIGRDEELAVLIKESRIAIHGEGRVLAIVGDVGVGKTRMIGELVRRLILASTSEQPSEAVPNFQIYTGDGQSFKQNVPYVTLRTPIIHLLGFTTRQNSLHEEWGQDTIVPQLQDRVDRLAPEFSHFMPLLGDMLGITLPDTPLTKGLGPEQRHDRTQELVVALVLGAANQEPLLLFIDDVQWADSSSVDLLNRLSKATTNKPLLIVLCYRSDTSVQDSWSQLPTTTKIHLSELSQENSSALVRAILNGYPPPELLPLLHRTQGNPFFIEELVRVLIASNSLIRNKNGYWQLTCPAEQITVPSSIEGLIMARLDRLDEPLQELVQVASVIGHRFQYQIVQGVYKDHETLYKRLQLLREADIIVIDEQQSDLTYLFRHALLRDVAYEGILFAQRRDLHRRVAQRIEELSTSHLDEHLTLLARHYLLAEDWESAFQYHLAAGIQAQKRYVNRDALTLFATALDIAPQLKNKPKKKPKGSLAPHHVDFNYMSNPLYALAPNVAFQVEELYERSAYIHALLGDYDQAQMLYLEALTLVNQLVMEHEKWKFSSVPFPISPDQLSIIQVRLHRHLASLQEQRANYESAFDWLERGMSQATPVTRSELARCYVLGARIYYSQGEYANALDWSRLGLSIAELVGNRIDQAHALLLMGNLWRDRGEFALSIPALEQARDILDEMKDASRLGEALNNLGDTYWRVGRWQDAIKCLQKSLQVSENIGDVLGMARTSNNLSDVMVGRGELQLAAELYKYSSEQFKRIGSLLGLAVTAYKHGKVLLLQETPREALHLFRASITSLERLNARIDLPEVLCLASEAALMLEQEEQATDYATQSLSIASELGMVIEEAHARLMLGQIAFHKHDFATADQHLSSSYAMLEKLDNLYGIGKVLFWQAKLAHANEQHDQVKPLLKRAEQTFKQLRAKRDLALVKKFASDVVAVVA